MTSQKPGASTDAIALLTRQHREVEETWSQLQAAHRNDDDTQQHLGQQIVTLLSQHDAIEEQLLYPAVADTAPEGSDLANHSLREHQKVRELLSEVDGRDPADEQVFATFTRCLEAVQHHVQEEEGTIFPQLREHCGQERLSDMGHLMAAALKVAPTHPHPEVPQSKVGAMVGGAVAGAVDKARDALRKNT